MHFRSMTTSLCKILPHMEFTFLLFPSYQDFSVLRPSSTGNHELQNHLSTSLRWSKILLTLFLHSILVIFHFWLLATCISTNNQQMPPETVWFWECRENVYLSVLFLMLWSKFMFLRLVVSQLIFMPIIGQMKSEPFMVSSKKSTAGLQLQTNVASQVLLPK